MLRQQEHREGEQGQAIVMFALVITVLMIFASLAIDVGLLRNNRQILVNAVDSAALAGGTLMPVDGSVPGKAAAVKSLVTTTLTANYPGILPSQYTITYKCLVGIDTSTPPKPYISRDIPAACDPSKSLGRQPVASDFAGAGSNRFMSCNPTAGDKCNVVLVSAATDTKYSFGPVVGITKGSTGVVNSAACNGPCGTPPSIPVDLVILIDRTASMSNADVQATRDAANAVLKIYDPAVQRVALGLLGPSGTSSTCGSPSVAVRASSSNYGTNTTTDMSKWIPVGLTGIGAPGYNESYATGGVLNSSSHIVSAISCFDHPGGTGTNLATPMAMATKYLQTYGRPGVKWGIILETDGQPNYGVGTASDYTCAQSNTNATAAKNAGIEVFTIGFGLDGSNNATCPDGSGTWNGKKVTSLLASMASQPSTDNLCTAAENSDGDHFYCEPKTSDLTAVFTAVATQFAGLRTHLVKLYPIPSVTSVSPSTGTHLGGATITVNGKYFSGATSVTFSGASAGYVILSDTQIKVVTPAGAKGSVANIVVTTPGGSSPIVSADKYTFN
jgi:Flp pilus assembly protein TadG